MENKNDDNTQNKSNTYNNNNQQDDKYIDTLSTPNWVSKEWREKQQATLNPTRATQKTCSRLSPKKKLQSFNCSNYNYFMYYYGFCFC